MGGVGCDNMTVILACFLHGKTYTHLSERCCSVPEGSPADRDSTVLYHHPGPLLTKPHISSYCHTDPLDLRDNGNHHKGKVVSEMKCNSQQNDSLTKPQQLSCTV